MMKLVFAALFGMAAAANHSSSGNTSSSSGNTSSSSGGSKCSSGCKKLVVESKVTFPIPGNATAANVGNLLKSAVFDALKTAGAKVVLDNVFISSLTMDGKTTTFTKAKSSRMLAVTNKAISFTYEVEVAAADLAGVEAAGKKVDGAAFFAALKKAVQADTTMKNLYSAEGVTDVGAHFEAEKDNILKSYSATVKASAADASSAFQTGAFAAIATALIALAF